MIGSNTPSCSATNSITITECLFSSQTKQVTLFYSASSSVTASTTFSVGSFKNPITPQPLMGFSVVTEDASGNSIGAISSMTLSGVTTPAAFQAY